MPYLLSTMHSISYVNRLGAMNRIKLKHTKHYTEQEEIESSHDGENKYTKLTQLVI